jgi:YVTN family beta-propeller protein
MKRHLPLALFLVLFLILAALAQPAAEEDTYLSPSEIAVSHDGRWLYVVCENSDELRVVDARSQKVVKTLPVGHVPRDVAISADGKRIYVTNSWVDTVSVIDADKLAIIGTLKTGFEPISAVPDLKNQTLYVSNRLSNDISVIDLRSGQEIKRLTAGRGASYMAISADGSCIYGSHIYPRIEGNRHPPESEITVIDTASRRVVEREPLHNVAGVFHLALSADGKLGVAAELRPKNLIPLAHVEHGWVFVDSLTVFGDDVGGTVEVPIDELERYFARPFGVTITPDKSQIFVTAGGSNNVTVIGVARLLKFIRASHRSFANDLSASANYVTARIPVGRNPRGVALSPDGKLLYVANRMDDNISVIDTAADRVVSAIDLGGPKTVTPIRRGEQIFYTTKFSFQGEFGCANCHIDATFDGMEWDLEPDGFGVDIVDNRSIEDLSGTEPFKWNGGNPNMPTECGPRTEKYFYRSQSYNERELADLVTFVLSLPVRPNRYRSPDGALTPAQERGKAIFERTHYKNGKPIPQTNQCAYCHSGPKYTNRKSFDVGSGKPTDRSPLVDVAHLPDVVYSAPYLHDGSARSLEEIWTVFNPKDTHGVTNDLTKDELNDLIEYLKTL